MEEAWLKTFPAALPEEVAMFRKGGMVAELCAVAYYAQRVRVSEGPALMYFRYLTRPAVVVDVSPAYLPQHLPQDPR